MKSSIGVTLFALVVLAGSALMLAGAVGMGYMFTGPMSRELLDPTVLPPGADVNMLRAMGMAAALIFVLIGLLGVTIGVGLIRLWRWARYAVIVFSSLVVLSSVLLAILAVVSPPPANVARGPEFERLARLSMLAFDAAWFIGGAGFLWFFLRKATAEQFNSGVVSAHRTRPLSISIIGWVLLVSGVFMLPMVFLPISIPAFLLGITFVGTAAKAFYAVYVVAYVAVGVGLLKEQSWALTTAIVLHIVGLLNSLSLAVPSIWTRYHLAVQSMSTLASNEPPRPSVQLLSVGSGLVVGGLILYFLMKERTRQRTTSLI